MASDYNNSLQDKSNESRTKRESKSSKIGKAMQVQKRKKRAMDAQGRWKVIETKLKLHNNTMKMAAISRTGIDWISVEVNNSDLSKESSCPDLGNRRTTTTTMVTKAISGQQTLKDALCSAMKTSRYAEIISKAESDRVGLQQERERMKTEGEGRRAFQEKQEREQEREAIRVTLETMKRRAELELEDNLMILKELEMLSGCCPAYVIT